MKALPTARALWTWGPLRCGWVRVFIFIHIIIIFASHFKLILQVLIMISATSSVLYFSALQTVSLPSVSRVIRSTDVQDEVTMPLLGTVNLCSAWMFGVHHRVIKIEFKSSSNAVWHWEVAAPESDTFSKKSNFVCLPLLVFHWEQQVNFEGVSGVASGHTSL